MNQITLFLLAAVGIVALIDFLPRLIIKKNRQPKVVTSYSKIPHYLILPTVYGDISYLKNIQFLKKYSNKVVICTSKFETNEFYTALHTVCKKYGFSYVCADLPVIKERPLKNAYTIYRGVLDAGLLKVPGQTPLILMDADTYATQNVNNLVRAFIKSKLNVASLRCEASNTSKIIEQLQEFEYRIAMDGRNMDPWLTSGACSIAYAEVYNRIFSRHSNFFAGGDIEIGKLGQIMGYNVGHLDFTFYTEVPDTLKVWFNQRIIWFAGGIRHHVTNIASFGWYHFFMLFYNSLLIYLLFPLRWIEFVNMPILLPITILFSWLYVVVLTHGKGWKPVYLLLPLYSFVQTMIIIPLALIKYFKLVQVHRSFGHLQHDLSDYNFMQRFMYRTLNFASAALIIIAAYLFTANRVEYWINQNTDSVSTTAVSLNE
ncbi:MAG: glycosyltransferase family 2 protein [bacterium]|nr:glycosyltransferase family 2 protein [bacterium]